MKPVLYVIFIAVTLLTGCVISGGEPERNFYSVYLKNNSTQNLNVNIIGKGSSRSINVKSGDIVQAAIYPEIGEHKGFVYPSGIEKIEVQSAEGKKLTLNGKQAKNNCLANVKEFVCSIVFTERMFQGY